MPERREFAPYYARLPACPDAGLCPPGHWAGTPVHASESFWTCSFAVSVLYMSSDGEQCKDNRNWVSHRHTKPRVRAPACVPRDTVAAL